MAHPVLINGEWSASTGTSTFQAANPATDKVSGHRGNINAASGGCRTVGLNSTAGPGHERLGRRTP